MDERFLHEMKELLGSEYDAWYSSLDLAPQRGFRLNLLKTDEEEFFSLMPLEKERTPFCDHGYYLHDEKGLGVSPAYLAGLFYIQEPSASSAVTILAPQKGDKVLDMCAAPGSKSTQIAEMLGNTGFLCANEINAKRAAVLKENIERQGAGNVLILNSDTSALADAFPAYFDRVLCDAPCSGEGMMRKNETAEEQWSPELVASCAERQKEILENAYRCLSGGGTLVYSTCTFNRHENEEVIASFLKRHADMHMDTLQVSFGRQTEVEGFGRAIRIFPMDGGEGHFICRMKKDGEIHSEVKRLKESRPDSCVLDFLHETMENSYPYVYQFRNRVYGGLFPFTETGHCHVLSQETYLGEIKGKRFVPSHAFFLSSCAVFREPLELNEEEVHAYLHGEQINRPASKGWHPVCWKGHALGGVHSDGKALKNKYPKQFRLR
jgi:NOL1/NOP2/sun family putative RNA methylase